MSKVGKRPLRSLSAHEKMDAIRRVHDGESKASVARDIGVPESTLRGWCKNEDKILYLSRQSTPETDDSEPREKKTRYELNGISEPYNLSVKIDSPPPQKDETALNLTKETPKITTSVNTLLTTSVNSLLTTPVTNTLLNTSVTNTQMSERERNRAELTRLAMELGLNKPEMFLPNQTETNWTQLITQATQQVLAANKVSKQLRHSFPLTQNLPQAPLPQKTKPKLEKTLEPQQSVDDSVWYWLKTQQAMLGLQNTSQAVDQNSSWFWKWYKQFYTPQSDTMLYQQLTKDNSENHNKIEKPKTQNNKSRAVLDNLLLNNNNEPSLSVVQPEKNEKTQELSPSEALEHGEKFLKWLECFSDPSVTAMQVLQFRYLLNNVRSCTDRKNSTDIPKIKVKRK